MSRVRSATTLQVIGFNRTQVIPADHEVIMQCSRVTGEHSDDLRCCRRKVTRDESFFDVQDRYRFAVGDSADAEDCYEFPIEVSDGKVQSYFEREDTDLEVSVAQLFEQMEKHESELSHPPSEGLDATPLLIKLKVNTPFSEFSRAINENVDLVVGRTLHRKCEDVYRHYVVPFIRSHREPHNRKSRRSRHQSDKE